MKKMIMLENPEGTMRYDFFLVGIKRSNIDSTIVRYEPHYRYHQFLGTGSTVCEDKFRSREDGNQFFLKLKSEGWKVVDFNTMSFA